MINFFFLSTKSVHIVIHIFVELYLQNCSLITRKTEPGGFFAVNNVFAMLLLLLFFSGLNTALRCVTFCRASAHEKRYDVWG